MKLLTLRFPERSAEVIAFVKRHHYIRSAASVYQVAYAWENDRGRLQAVHVVAQPPYPSVARAFVRDRQYAPRVAYQSRLVGAGISKAELDELLNYSAEDLYRQGFYWLYALADPISWVIDNVATRVRRIVCRGFTGDVYQRTGFLFLGYTEKPAAEAFLVDGQLLHIRQGPVTLTRGNIREHYPQAREIRVIGGTPKMRWARVLAQTERERGERVLLMRYHPQPYAAAVQPRLLSVWQRLAGEEARHGAPA